MPEILSPAGNRQALEAAVQCGADAVYLGASAFSARALAGNFGPDDLQDAVRYAHVRGRRIYLAVNTLLHDQEMPRLREVAADAARAGVDAIIVQDVGVLSVLRQLLPDMPFHASTQMAVHSLQGAQVARRLGCCRVVLARECSLAQAREIAAAGPEVEVFAHGALCVAQSGQCLMSSMAGGRSGNRGRCAQPCRQMYEMNGRGAYLLSPKDLCMLGHMAALVESGAAALKIEGRMKRPQYVAAVTRAYRQALDEALEGRAFDAEAAAQDVKRAFHRGGFTTGHLLGSVQDEAFLSTERPGHEGLPVGWIDSVGRGMAQATLTAPLTAGDGLEARGAGEGGGVSVTQSAPAGRAHLRVPAQVKAGMALYRTTDAAQDASIAAYLREEHAAAPVRLTLTVRIGAPAELLAEDAQGRSARATSGQSAERTLSRALTAQDWEKQLRRTGGTPFCISSVVLHTQEEAYLSAAQLNALRRDALDALAEHRILAARPFLEPASLPAMPDTVFSVHKTARPSQWFAQVATAEQARTCARAGVERVLWHPADFRPESLERASAGLPDGVWLHLPPCLSTGALKSVCAWVTACGRFSGYVAANIGQVGAIPLPFMADASLHCMNLFAAGSWISLGAERVTLSPELSRAQSAPLLAAVPCDVRVYGREALMNLRHCPARAAGASCDRMGGGCAAHGLWLTSHLRQRFPLWPLHAQDGCTVQVLNAPILSLHREIGELTDMGAASLRAVFREETPEECARILRALRDPASQLHGEGYTRGHWLRGVE